MDDSFLRDVAKLRQDKNREQIRQGLANSSGRVYQAHLEAMRQIEDEDSAEAKRVAGQRHEDSMQASSHANRRANQALSVAAGSLILALIAILQQCQAG